MLDGKIYLAGGYNGGYLNTVAVYDPTTNTWSAGPRMLTARGYMGAAVLGGKLYVAGGDGGLAPLSSMEVFDPQTNAWTQLAPMGTARKLFQLVAAQGKLCAVGGMTTGVNKVSSVEAYDPQQNRWEAAAPLSGPRIGHAIVAM